MTTADSIRRSLAWATGPVLVAAGMVGCSKEKPAPPPQVEVVATAAALQPVTEEVRADAVLTPAKQAAITPKISAPVKKFYVQRGAHVKAGELLAVLDNSDLRAAVTDNKGALDAAEANYQTAVKAQVPADYQTAQLDLKQAKANLDLNQSIVTSREKLYKEGAIPERDLQTSQAALVQAQAAYDTAEQHMNSMKQVSHAAELKAAKGQLESARGKYQGAAADLSYSEIRTPISGVVTESSLYAGETPAASAPLMTVMDTSALLAKIHISQEQAQMLSRGDAATVTVPGLDKPVAGKITLVSPALDPGSTTVEVWVRIENPKGELRPGTAVHVNVSGRTVKNTLAVPTAAIVMANNGQPTVMVVGSDGVAHQVQVTTGISGGGLTQILSGLTAGQQVITTGAFGLDDGTRVKVVSALEYGGGTGAGSGSDSGSGDDK